MTAGSLDQSRVSVCSGSVINLHKVPDLTFNADESPELRVGGSVGHPCRFQSE